MSVFAQFSNAEALIAQAKAATARSKGLPVGTGYAGKLVQFEVVPGKDDPENIEEARVHYVVQVTAVPPTVDAKWVGKSHHEWAGFKPFTNSNGEATSMGADVICRLYRDITGARVDGGALTLDDLGAMVAKITEVAEAQAGTWEFAVVANKKNPEYTNFNFRKFLG